MKLQSSNLSTLALSLLLAISVTPALAQPYNAGPTATDLTLAAPQAPEVAAEQEAQVYQPVEIPLASLFAYNTPRVYLTTDLTLAPAGVVPVDPHFAAQAMQGHDATWSADGNTSATTLEPQEQGMQSEEVQVPQLAENQTFTDNTEAPSGNVSGEEPVVPTPVVPVPAEGSAEAEQATPVVPAPQEPAQPAPNFTEAPAEPEQPGVPAEANTGEIGPAQVADDQPATPVVPVPQTALTLGASTEQAATPVAPSEPVVGSAVVPSARPYTTPKLRPTKQVATPASPDLPLNYSTQFQPNITLASEFRYPSYMLMRGPMEEPTLDNNPPTDAVEHDASLGVEFEGVPYGAGSNLTLPTPIDSGALPVPETVAPTSQEQQDSAVPVVPQGEAPLVRPAPDAADNAVAQAQVEALTQKFLADCFAQNQVPADYTGLRTGLTLPTASELAIAQAYQACQDQATQVRAQLESNPALSSPNYLQTYTLYTYPKIGVNDYPSRDGHHRFPNNDAAHVWPNPSNPTATSPALVDGTFHSREEIELAGDQGLNESTRQVLVPEHNLFTKLADGLKNTPNTLGHLQNIAQGLELASKDAAGQLFNQALIGTDPTQLAHSRYLFTSSNSDVTKYRSVGVPVSPANIGGFWPNPDPSLNNIVISDGVTLNTWDERVLNPYAPLIRDFQPTLTEIGTFVNDPNTGHSRFGVPFEVESPVQPLTPAQRLKANEHRQVTDQQAYLARAYLNSVFAKYYGDTVAAQPVSMSQLNKALAQQGASEFVSKYHLLTIAPITDKVLSTESFEPVVLAEDANVPAVEQGNLDGTQLEQVPAPQETPVVPEGQEVEPVVPAEPAPVNPEPTAPAEPSEPDQPQEDNPQQHETKVHPFIRVFSVYR